MTERLYQLFEPEKFYTTLDLKIALIEHFNIELHINTIYHHIRNSRLKAYKGTKYYQIKGSDIVEWWCNYFFKDISQTQTNTTNADNSTIPEV
jgi:hypothetical protein